MLGSTTAQVETGRSRSCWGGIGNGTLQTRSVDASEIGKWLDREEFEFR